MRGLLCVSVYRLEVLQHGAFSARRRRRTACCIQHSHRHLNRVRRKCKSLSLWTSAGQGAGRRSKLRNRRAAERAEAVQRVPTAALGAGSAGGVRDPVRPRHGFAALTTGSVSGARARRHDLNEDKTKTRTLKNQRVRHPTIQTHLKGCATRQSIPGSIRGSYCPLPSPNAEAVSRAIPTRRFRLTGSAERLCLLSAIQAVRFRARPNPLVEWRRFLQTLSRSLSQLPWFRY